MFVQPAVLDSSVLVLNKHYMAIRVISARRAFALLWISKAEVVAQQGERWNGYDLKSWIDASRLRQEFEGHDDWVKAVRFDLRVPRIVRLLVYDHLPPQDVKLNRKNIYARDHNLCQYCGRRFPPSELSLDHVVPRSLGGRSTWTNLVCACTACNSRKAGKTLDAVGLRLVKLPLKPRRSPVVTLKVRSEKYQSWKQFLDNAYWSVELEQD